MNSESGVPPVLGRHPTITYELTRWDVFVQFSTLVLRNRLLQVFVVGALMVEGWLILGPMVGKHSLAQLIVSGMAGLLPFFVFLAITLFGVASLNAFIPKHRGVLGSHTMEITEEGLVERTAYNASLHRWDSVCRICHLFGYAYIYVGSDNIYLVPKRSLPPSEIDGFIAEVSRRAGR